MYQRSALASINNAAESIARSPRFVYEPSLINVDLRHAHASLESALFVYGRPACYVIVPRRRRNGV